MKKLFAILMSIMMIACFMPSMAFAGGAGTATISLVQGDEGTAVGDSITVTYGQTIAPITVKRGNEAINSSNETTLVAL